MSVKALHVLAIFFWFASIMFAILAASISARLFNYP